MKKLTILPKFYMNFFLMGNADDTVFGIFSMVSLLVCRSVGYLLFGYGGIACFR